MTACTSPSSIERSTPLTISFPVSCETCRFLISSNGIGFSLAKPLQQPDRGPRRALPRPVGEAAAGAGVARKRLEQVVRRVDRLRVRRVLALPAHAPEHPVAGARRELLAPEELLRAPPDRQLADRVLAAVQHRLRERLGLVDRR